jgi:hypothetical protein
MEEPDRPRLVGGVPSPSCRAAGPDRPVHLDVRARRQRDAHAGRPRRARPSGRPPNHTPTAAVVAAATGALVEQLTVPATPAGDQQLLRLADRPHGRRGWAMERTGGSGAGRTRPLAARAEQVVELDRPKRAARRHGAKADPLDATRAAREALGGQPLAQPRATGHRAARSVRLAARRSAVPATPTPTPAPRPGRGRPDTLGARLRQLPTPRLVSTCGRLRPRATWELETTATAASLRAPAAASNSSTLRLSTTPEPSPPWSGPGGLSCSPAAGSARSWPPSSGAPGPSRPLGTRRCLGHARRRGPLPPPAARGPGAAQSLRRSPPRPGPPPDRPDPAAR